MMMIMTTVFITSLPARSFPNVALLSCERPSYTGSSDEAELQKVFPLDIVVPFLLYSTVLQGFVGRKSMTLKIFNKEQLPKFL